MTEEGILFSVMGSITFDLLIVALSIFAWLTIRSMNIRTFQFQISVLLIIWIIGEIVDLLQRENLFSFLSNDAGMKIHLLAMAIFSGMLWTRFYLSVKSGKKIKDKPAR
jgi:hypothetical protein